MRSNADKPASGNGWAAIAPWVVPRTGMSQTAVAAGRRVVIRVRRGISLLNTDLRLLEADLRSSSVVPPTSNHDEPQTHAFGHRICPPRGAQFCHDGGDVELGCVRSYVEVPRNGFVRRSFRQQPQHLQFSRSELDRRRLILRVALQSSART